MNQATRFFLFPNSLFSMTTATSRWTSSLLLLTLLLLGSAFPVSAQVFVASLSGASEVPANASTASGRVEAVLSGTQLVVTGAFTGLESDYTGSHIHEAPAGVNGGIIFTLTPVVNGDMRSGTFAAADNTFDLTAGQVTTLTTDGFYVNVHSVTLAGGEIRGQIGQSVLINEVDSDQTGTDAAEFVELYNPTASAVDLSDFVLVFFNGSDDASYEAFDLDGFTIDADGYFVLCANAATTANCDLDVTPEENLVQNGADAVALYMGEAASFPGDTPVTMAGLLDALVYDTADADDDGLLAGLGQMVQYNEDENGMKDTQSIQRNPSGAATIVVTEPTPGAGLVAPMGPVVTFTEGSASVDEGMMATLTVELDFPDDTPDGNPVTVSVDFDAVGSTADAADFTGPTPGSVTFSGNTDGEALFVTLDLTEMDGVEGSEDAVFDLTVTSGTADVGIPGTFTLTVGDTDMPPTSTMAEARALGSGATVIVEGVVTRSMGTFTYLQDDTGGLTVRQTSGTFFDAVAAGTIVSGTQLQLNGTLSEFNGLLQINDADLASWSILGTTTVPAPQVVDLAELAANGEAYEAELVQVDDLTIETADVTFAAATTYDVDDPSDDGDAMALRVPNADDSDVDGTAVPSMTVLFTGVIGQFDSSDPRDEGYQLMAIETGDLVITTANEPGEAPTLFALDVAQPNPFARQTTLQFSLDQSGPVRMAIYDALGREVAVLTEGELDARTHRVTFDARTLASGVYVVRLTAGEQTATQRITLLR
ncbi:MAG: CHRD domain-containing protein [Rhodothermaceae bacterium]|nr:CHRD domain-containing protein [Rhodothermaceae bacterium]